MAQQNLDFGTSAANDGEFFATAFPKIQANFDDLYGAALELPNAVSTVGYAASPTLTPNDSSDAVKTANTAAIQEVIDYAFENNVAKVKLPPGHYYCDPEIYLDPPANLRGTPGSIAQFTAHLTGNGGAGSEEPQGTVLRFTDASKKWIIVGSGQGMRVSDMGLLGASATSLASLHGDGIGIGITSVGGGAHNTQIENVQVRNVRRAYVTGWNGIDQLGDSNTFIKCSAADCYTGWDFSQSQNLINTLFDCAGSCKIGVKALTSTAVNIFGGNLSKPEARRKAFAISGTSGLTSFTDSTIPGSPSTNYSFETTLTSPDAYMAAGDYDVFAILTESFGVIPLVLITYNSGTGVATFAFYTPWWTSHWNNVVPGDTDLAAEIAAVTTLYAAEQVVTLRGPSISVHGLHLENQGSVTCFHDHAVNFQGARRSSVDGLYCNYNVNHLAYLSSTDDDKAAFYCQQVFPWLRHLYNDGASTEIANSHILSATGADSILIEYLGNSGAQLSVRNTGLRRPNIRVPLQQDYNHGAGTQSRGLGAWDQTPWVPSAETNEADGNGMARYLGPRDMTAPFLGFFPAPWAKLRINRTWLEHLDPVDLSVGNYPPLFGGTLYEVANTSFQALSATAQAQIASDHHGWSYGQDLTIDWSYKGQSTVLYLSDLSRMFPGLVIVLDNGGGDATYMVTGVYPSLGYVTVLALTGDSTKLLAGTKTTTYTGATVKQEAFSLRRVSGLPAVKSVANATSGATTAAAGDLTGAAVRVNLTLSAVGAANFTTRTAVQMFGDIPDAYAGLVYEVAISNASAGQTTLMGGTDVTVSGTATIAAGATRIFEVTFPTAATCTMTNKGALS